MIIGIIGNSESGKDTVANLIRDILGQSEWHIVHFADKLKKIASELTGEPLNDFYDNKNKLLSPEWSSNGEPITIRDFIQKLGTDAIRNNFHHNVWVNALFAGYKPIRVSNDTPCRVCGYNRHERRGNPCNVITCPDRLPEQYPNWIVADVRYQNEAQRVKDFGGVLIKVNREVGNSMSPSQRQRSSETELNYLDYDYLIENNGSLQELHENCVKLCKIL